MDWATSYYSLLPSYFTLSYSLFLNSVLSHILSLPENLALRAQLLSIHHWNRKINKLHLAVAFSVSPYYFGAKDKTVEGLREAWCIAKIR